MIYKNQLIWISSILAFMIFAPSNSFGQYVRDSAFCKKIVKHRCTDVLTHGSNVRIGSLPIVNGKRTIFFTANLRNPDEKFISLHMIRKGSCYKPDIVIPDRDFGAKTTSFQKVKAYLSSLTIREIWHMLGISEVQPGAVVREVDLRVTVVLVPDANIFRINTFRHVSCAGELFARVLDSKGNPIPGDNEIRVLIYN